MPVSSFLVGALFLLVSAVCPEDIHAASVSDDSCYMCHSREGSSIPYVDKEAAKDSAHNRFGCVSCHQDADSVPHAEDLDPVDCGLCHSSQAKTYLSSMHGLAAKKDRTVAAAHGGAWG